MWRGWRSGMEARPLSPWARSFQSMDISAPIFWACRDITFALAENGDFPSIFAAIHPRFRTPYVSILAFALLSWLLLASR